MFDGAHVDEATEISGVSMTLPASSKDDFGEIRGARNVRIAPGLFSNIELVGRRASFTELSRLSLDAVERFVLSPVAAFLMINRLAACPVQVDLILEDGSRAQVRRPLGPKIMREGESFVVAGSSISPDHLSMWFGMYRSLAPAPMVAAKAIANMSYDVEARILSLAASAEAVYRELYDHRRSTFADRLRNLTEKLGEIGDAVVGIDVGRVDLGKSRWVQEVRDVRNGFAHLNKKEPPDLREYSGRMFVLFESLQWLHLYVMFRYIGIPEEVISQGIQRRSGYQLFRRRALELYPEIYRSPEGQT